MPVIGLRLRFSVTILAVLLSVIVSSIYLYSVFLRRERLKLVDQQVRETATALFDSQLGDLRKVDFDHVEGIISEELGENRIGKFFVIRNSQGETIFESTGARVLPITDFPQDQQWFEITTKGRYIRGLNLQLPRIHDRTLQVGLVLEESLIDPGYFSKASFMFIVGVLALGLIVSQLLTSFLLRPISLLDQFLSDVTSSSKLQSILPLVPLGIAGSPATTSNDEFKRVVAGLNALISKVNKNYQISRLWTYQMAHELKTPLSLLSLGLERLQRKHSISESEFQDVWVEVKKISDTISSFLGWAELENSEGQKRLFANRLVSFMNEILARLPESQRERVQVKVTSDFIVAANPQHLEQLILNLIQNALKHGGPQVLVDIEVKDPELVVRDNGPGVPQDVLSRIGEPFNRGGAALQTSERGHGLGLAWVSSICRHYDWKLEFQSGTDGTCIRVQFGTQVNE